jgi:hypothetical protein
MFIVEGRMLRVEGRRLKVGASLAGALFPFSLVFPFPLFPISQETKEIKEEVYEIEIKCE